jgi:hypothetical protein
MKSMILATSFFLSTFAHAAIETYSDKSPVSDACTWTILNAIDATDSTNEGPVIGKDAWASFDDQELPAPDQNGEYTLAITVNEADEFDGYSTWRVNLANPTTSCDVRKVTLEDVAH